MDWVEVKGRTVEVAVAAALRELGVEDISQVEVEVLEEPQRGFLGLGGRDAVIRVKPKVRRRRRRGEGKSVGDRTSRGQQARRDPGQGPRREGSGGQGGRRPQRTRQVDRGPRPPDRAPIDAEAQAAEVGRFLEGLLEAFGLEGQVSSRVEGEETIVAEVSGEQTEALVGPRGVVIDAIRELCRTLLQRQGRETARLRLDISGYVERRRQALTIYAGQLIDQLVAEGGEIMLEPMTASDRKVIHDAVALRPEVRSFSEGEPPRRYVVIALARTEGETAREASP